LFADHELFKNLALPFGDNALFLARLLGESRGPVELVDRLSGKGSATPLESIRNAELAPFALQALAFVALFLLWKGAAFGTLRDLRARGRRAFAEHARALGILYFRARASQHVLATYAAWAMDRLRARSATKTGLSTLASSVAARTGLPEGQVMRVLVEAQAARDEIGPPSFRAPESGRAKSDPTTRTEFALMHELAAFVAAFGGRGPRDRGGHHRASPPSPSREPQNQSPDSNQP